MEPSSTPMMEPSSTPMFLGAREISLASVLDEKVLGEDLMEIQFKDGSSEVVTRRLFEAACTPESLTDSQFQEKVIDAIHPELAKLLVQWGLRVNWVGTLFDWTVNSLNLKLQDADRIVWGKRRTDVNLLDMDRLLSKVTVKDVLGN